MSFESPGFTAHRASAPQRASLYPEPSASYGGRGHGRGGETQLAGWFAKTLGIAILALSALFVAALLTWSIADPSFSNSGSNVGAGLKPKNLLGPIGAILSDIVIQSLGLASVFALLPPVFWAAQLLSRHGIDGARSKVVMAPIAVLCLAAFLSGLPKAAVWPLGSGYGGLLGDFGFQFVTGLFGIINAERAPLVTGVCLMAAGFSLLMLSLGLTPADLKRMAERRRKHVPDSAWVSHLKAAVVTSASDDDVLAAGPAAHAKATEAARTAEVPEPSLPMPPRAERQAPAAEPIAAAAGPVVPVQAPIPSTPVSRQAASIQVPAISIAPVASIPPVPPPARVEATPPAPRLGYRRPPLTLLPQSTAPRAASRDMHVAEKLRGRKLVEVLETYGVRAEVKGHVVGPVVTTFTIDPAAGTRPSRVISLADDIARGLNVASVRIQSTTARSAVAIEIPHDDPVTMGLRDFVAHDSYHGAGHMLPVVLGASAVGEPCVADLSDAAILVAGQDRGARDALINTAVASILYRHAPATLRFVFIGTDATSGRSFDCWAALPHLAVPAASDLAQATDLLSWAAAEIDARTLRMRAVAQAQTIDVYNQRLRANGQTESVPLPHLVLVIADLAAIVQDGSTTRLSALDAILRRGRAAGVHMIAATSSATEDALPPGLLAAFPVRLAAQVANKSESRALFGETGADDLPLNSDVLVYAGSDTLRKSLAGAPVQRLHAALIRATEASAIAMAAAKPGDVSAEVVSPARSYGMARDLQHNLRQQLAGAASDSLYDRAVEAVRREQSAQASMLKNELSLTTAMVSELLDQMARDGVVSAADAHGQRRVLLGRAA